jgi:hypothetical protein
MMNEPLNVNVKFVQIARMLLLKKKQGELCYRTIGRYNFTGVSNCPSVSDVSRNNVILTPLTATDSVRRYNYIPTDGASTYRLIPTIL